MKRAGMHIFSYGLLLLFLLTGGAACDRLRSNRDISEFASIPQNALWVMRFDNLKAFEELGKPDAAIGGILSVADTAMIEQACVFAHWMKTVPFLNRLSEQAFSISAHAIGKQDSWLFSFPKQPEDMGLWSQLRENGFKTEPLEPTGGELYRVIVPSGEALYAGFVSKNLLVCRSRIVLEGAIHQIKAGFSLASSPDFVYAYEQSGLQGPISMWLNLETVAACAQPIYRAATVNWLHGWHQTGKWMTFDLEPQDRSFEFEGLITQSPAEMSLSDVWKEKEEFDLSVWNVLPVNVKQGWVESVRNSERIIKKMVSYRDKRSESAMRLPQITQQLMAPKEAAAFVKQWDPQSVCLANVVMGDGVDIWMTVTHCGRIEAYQKAVMQALGSYNEMIKLGDLHLVRSFPLDSTGTSLKVYINPFKFLYPYIYGEMFTLASDAYIGFYGNFAVMGPTPVSVLEWVQSVRSGKVLERMDAMQTLKDESKTKAVLFYFLRPDLQRTPWINALRNPKSKKLNPSRFDKKWRGLWMRMRSGDEYLRLEGAFVGRSDQDTLSFSSPAMMSR